MNDDRPSRQVLPDVDEGAEFFGHSIFGLMRIYFAPFGMWFIAMHFAPPGWGWLAVLIGTILFIGATVAVFAAPAHVSPSEYARSVYRQYTQQGVELHE